MIRTQTVAHEGKVEVEFVLPDAPDGPLSVVGDFNGWDPHVTPMLPGAEGYEATVTVDAGRRYAFRYLGVDGTWFNDDTVGTYEPGPYGADNCVIDVTDVIDLRPPVPAAAPRKPRARKPRSPST